MSDRISRRQFLNSSSRTVAGAAVGAGLLGSGLVKQTRAQGVRGANERIVVGLIGCGGMGTYKTRNFMKIPGVEIAALADPDPNRPQTPIIEGPLAPDIEKQYGRKPFYTKDFRELIDRDDIDVCLVSTPDHWHALAMIHACLAGKDVYVEKPCCHNIHEGQLMVKAARKHNRIVQVGMQQRSAPHFQKAVKLIQDGLLGDIAYTRTWRVQNHAPDGIGMGGDPMPKGMDYNMWLGPAPKVEYNSNRCHYNWRWFYDYGCTLVGDWNVHLQDIVHWATGTYSPISVVATGGKNILKDNRDTPDTLNVSYDFQRPDGKKFVQTFTFTFCCGSPLQDHPYGIQFFSENGSMFIDRENGYESFPDTKGAHDAQGNRIRVDRMEKVSGKTDDPAYPHQAHAENFIACVRSRKREDLHVDIETGFMTAAACHLGNISYKLGGRKIWWDADKQIITHQDGTPDDEANVHLSKPQGYRAPFTLPEV